MKHKCLYSNSSKPVWKLFPVIQKCQISRKPSNSGMKMIQLLQGGLAHQLAKYGAHLLARLVFMTDRNFLECKLNAGKIIVLTLQAQLQRFATCFAIR